MHIPPLYKKKTWQLFIIGTVVGGVLSYLVYIYMYGSLYEQVVEENLQIQSELTELQSQNEALLEDNADLDEKSKEPVTVDAIEISFANQEELRLDRLIVHQLEEMIKEEINHLIGQDLSIVAESDQLLEAAIENKGFSVDGFTYYFEVHKLYITKTIKLNLETKLSN
ncbi:sporulation membrane protein YtrI [Virgibacillus ainsalahensis]